MRIDLDSCEEILTTITKNKTRSILTAFGVFWGIFMLITLIGGGQGLKHFMQKNFAGFATNSGFVVSQKTSEPFKGFSKGRRWDLVIKDIERLKRGVPEIDIITPSIARWGEFSYYKDKKIGAQVKGLYPNYSAIEYPEIKYGRYINEIDIKERRKICVIGKRIYESLFTPGENPCGKQIKVGTIYYTVVGVSFSESNMNIQGPTSDSVMIPYTTMQETFNIGDEIHVICFTAKKNIKVSEIEPKIKRIIKKVHLISPDDKQAVMTLNAEAMFSMVNNLFKGINILIWMVGLGTLLAGAIGVSNIMMVTVKERTTEIGIRRAIGAQPRDILEQILAESVLLTSFAGMLGITVGVLILQGVEVGIASTGQAVHFQVSFWLAIFTCILVIALGIIAGLAPAYRAMNIKPIEAIRDE